MGDTVTESIMESLDMEHEKRGEKCGGMLLVDSLLDSPPYRLMIKFKCEMFSSLQKAR